MKSSILRLELAENDTAEPETVEPVENDHRSSSFDLTAVIKGREKNFRSWSETARVESLSTSGAGFFLSRPCEIGRLVSLIIAMPSHFRRYEIDKKLYRIWGLVQYCYQAGGDEEPGFHIGVALIGKDAPTSFRKNPTQSYRVSGVEQNGLWRIEPLESSYRSRASVRHWNSIESYIYLLDNEQQTIAAEKTVTENISETGASVFSDLRLKAGDKVRFQTSSPAFSTIAIVRHRRLGLDDRTRIHLEFAENKFPVFEPESPIEQPGEH